MITSTSVLSPSQPLRCTAKDLTVHWQLKTTAVNAPPRHCALLTHVVVISVAIRKTLGLSLGIFGVFGFQKDPKLSKTMRQQVFRETGTLSPKDGHIFNGSSRIFQRQEDIFVKTIFVFEYHLSEVFAHILVSISLVLD